MIEMKRIRPGHVAMPKLLPTFSRRTTLRGRANGGKRRKARAKDRIRAIRSLKPGAKRQVSATFSTRGSRATQGVRSRDLKKEYQIREWITLPEARIPVMSEKTARERVDDVLYTKYVDKDPDPSPNAGATKLRQYWTKGPGAAKIKWGTDGDFDRCVSHLRKHVGTGAEGLCNVYHRSATGSPPGKGPHV